MLVYQEFHYVLLLFLYCRLKLVDKRCKIQATKCQGLNSTEHSFKGEKFLSFFLCLELVEPKAPCYRARVCVHGFSHILSPTTRDHFRAMFVWFSYPEKTWRTWQLFASKNLILKATWRPKGFLENFLALSVKKLKKVLMILPSIGGRGRAFAA